MIKGYRKKPAWIYYLAVSYLLLPVASVIQFWFKVEHSWPLLKEILVSHFFLTELFCSLSAALAVYVVTRWSFLYLIGLSLYAIWVKVSSLRYYGVMELPVEILVLIFWSSVVLLMLFTALRVPYLNPRLQWWKQPARYGVLTRGVLYFKDHRFPVVTLNLSSSGVFLKADERALSGEGDAEKYKSGNAERRRQEAAGSVVLSKEELAEVHKYLGEFPRSLGENVFLKLQLNLPGEAYNPQKVFESEAEVAWATDPASAYRYGLGLKFKGIKALEKRKLKEYLADLKRFGLEKRVR